MSPLMQRRPPSSSPADSSSLLDHLIAEPGSRDVGCCNELNAGYAADGSARARAVGAYVVTFIVGRLSIINAIAGAYSENLPAVSMDDQILIIMGLIGFCITRLGYRILANSYAASRLFHAIRY